MGVSLSLPPRSASDSRYLPGKRSPAWRKIKPAGVLPCVVIGYRPGRDGSCSSQLTSMREGVLRYVGQVRRGFGTSAAAVLAPVPADIVETPGPHSASAWLLRGAPAWGRGVVGCVVGLGP